MLFIVLSIVFGIIQICMWGFLPKWLMNWIFRIPLLAIILNFLGSFIIMKFAGSSALIGGANMTGSLIFALYILYYNSNNKEVFNGKRKPVSHKKVPTAGKLAGPIVLREKRR